MIQHSKYEYLLKVWGGFWNEHNYNVHKEPEVMYRWFNSKEERQKELNRLLKIANELKTKDAIIANSFYEGYLTRFEVVLQSHILYEGHIHIIENNLGYGFGMDADFDILGDNYSYMKEWKFDIMGNTEVIPDLDKAERLFTTVILR